MNRPIEHIAEHLDCLPELQRDIDAIIAKLAAAEAERDELKELVIEYASDAFFEIATKEKEGKNAGWYCTNARTTAVCAGQQLVDLGKMEKKENAGCGRVQYFRPTGATP